MVIMATFQHNATNLSVQMPYRGRWIDLISTLELFAIFFNFFLLFLVLIGCSFFRTYFLCLTLSDKQEFSDYCFS